MPGYYRPGQTAEETAAEDCRADTVRRALAVGVDAYWFHGKLADYVRRFGPTNHVAAAGDLHEHSGDVARWADDLVRAGILREVPPQWDYAPPGLRVRWFEYVQPATA